MLIIPYFQLRGSILSINPGVMRKAVAPPPNNFILECLRVEVGNLSVLSFAAVEPLVKLAHPSRINGEPCIPIRQERIDDNIYITFVYVDVVISASRFQPLTFTRDPGDLER